MELPTSFTSPVVLAGGGALLLLCVLGLWLLLGRGPRLRRGLKRARRLLHEGKWHEALQVIRSYQEPGKLPALWEGRLRFAEGECRRAAALAALKEREYEKALEYQLAAADLLNLPQADARHFIIEAMLEEVRRLFAATSGRDTDAVHQMIGRTVILQANCPEAFFWKGLCHLREDNLELTLTSLTNACQAASGFLDPPLYLGGVLLRQGQPKDALRFLTEANRLDSNCALVTLQLGTAIIAAGGDPQIAVRALQRALGPRGLGVWLKNPARFWVEVFPEHRSYVRKLALKHPYVCPLFGSDVAFIMRQGNLALAQGLYRQGNFQESADLYLRLLQESAPSHAVLRGLGLALTRQDRYDEAFKHLRTAHEMEQPPDRLTAGYLALCGARGKPSRPEDKAANVAWAIRLVRQFTSHNDPEWAQLLNQIYAEARAENVPLAVEDHYHLCDHLLSINATDTRAAEGFHHFAATFPDAVRPQHAWLYSRAAQLHKLRGPCTLDLFALAFKDQAAAREYFQRYSWDFDEVEAAYLERAAEMQPGSFPQALGPDYAARGEEFLLARSLKQEQAGQPDAALATIEVLLQLAPGSLRAHDRLAQLYYQRGNRERTLELLQSWQRLEPRDPLPLLRVAVLHQQLGQAEGCLESVRAALNLAEGPRRGEIAFLGARLVLGALRVAAGGGNGKPPVIDAHSRSVRAVIELLTECLNQQPDHVEAVWVLAALRSLRGERQELAELAPRLNRPEVSDPRFHYCAAVCRLAAGDYEGVLEACGRIPADSGLAVESAYLTGWAHTYRQDPAAAVTAFLQVAQRTDSPSAPYAQAILGGIRFHEGAYHEAVRWWKALDAQKRAQWHFDEALHKTVFLAALDGLQAGSYEQSAEQFREAGRLGLRDRRLGPLLTLALVKAGQRLLYKS